MYFKHQWICRSYLGRGAVLPERSAPPLGSLEIHIYKCQKQIFFFRYIYIYHGMGASVICCSVHQSNQQKAIIIQRTGAASSKTTN